MVFIGSDVSQRRTAISIVDSGGAAVAEGDHLAWRAVCGEDPSFGPLGVEDAAHARGADL